MANNTLSKKDNILQAVKFALFSVSAGVIQIVTFTLLNELIPDVQGNNAFTKWFFESEYGAYYLVALILSILWNFTVNRKFTFKSATNIPIAMLKVFGFYPLPKWCRASCWSSRRLYRHRYYLPL